MPAHVPRRTFAKPFVVTFAAASAIACAPKAVEPPSHNPPAQDAPPAAAGDRTWKLERASDGTCTAQLRVECAAGETCVQPKPQTYACPAAVLNYPAGISLPKGETQCKAYWDPPALECPPTATCNPPPTQEVDVPCPK